MLNILPVNICLYQSSLIIYISTEIENFENDIFIMLKYILLNNLLNVIFNHYRFNHAKVLYTINLNQGWKMAVVIL